jgi:Flp pilus assembly protein TadG
VNAGGRGAHGQILALFVLSAVTIFAMVGLVVDGGSTFTQRRSQQNAADLAALAAANTYLLTNDETLATAAATTSTALNGYTNHVNGTTVTVTYDLSAGALITVGITAQHRNVFTPAVGINSWQVSTTATVLTGFPDTGKGAAPFIGNIHVFTNDGNPDPMYANPNAPFAFGDGNGDVPRNAADVAWTNYGAGNVNTSDVDALIKGTKTANETFGYGENLNPYIGQFNNGNHAALFSDVDQYLSGRDLPVPIVDDNGYFQGWSVFHVVSGDTSSKKIVGYFKASFESTIVEVNGCASGTCPRYLGAYVLRLVN